MTDRISSIFPGIKCYMVEIPKSKCEEYNLGGPLEVILAEDGERIWAYTPIFNEYAYGGSPEEAVRSLFVDTERYHKVLEKGEKLLEGSQLADLGIHWEVCRG